MDEHGEVRDGDFDLTSVLTEGGDLRDGGRLGTACCGGRVHLNLHGPRIDAEAAAGARMIGIDPRHLEDEAGNGGALDANQTRALAQWLRRAADKIDRDRDAEAGR